MTSSTPSAVPDNVVLLTVTESAGRRKVIAGVFLAVISQFGWGVYPVLARVLQTQHPALTLLELIVALNALSAITLAAAMLAKKMLLRMWRIVSPQKSLAASKVSRPAAPAAGGSQLAKLLIQLPLPLLVGLFGSIIAARAITNIASTAFAPAVCNQGPNLGPQNLCCCYVPSLTPSFALTC